LCISFAVKIAKNASPRNLHTNVTKASLFSGKLNNEKECLLKHMTLVEDIVGWVKNQAVYLTGRGLLGLGMAFGGLVGDTMALVIAIGGTAALQGAITWRKERRAERQLVNAYREEVSASLGIRPEDVTVEQLQEVAYGNPEIAGDGNAVLKDALDRNSQKHMLQFVSSGISALATFGIAVGLLGVFDINLVDQVDELRKTFFSGTLGIVGSAATAAGVMTVAGSGMSILNQIFDRVGERVLGIHKATAHDVIVGISRDVSRGKMVSQEQVFGVFVAAQPDLSAAIEQEYGRAYDKLKPRQQFLALQEYGDHYHIGQLTEDINRLLIKPQELAFAAVGQSSGVAPKYDVNFREEALREKTYGDLAEEVKRAVVGDDGSKKPEEAADIANDNVPGFANRFVPRDAQEAQSFVDRYAPERKDSKLESVLEKFRDGGPEAGR
jgi:hypothetical protein